MFEFCVYFVLAGGGMSYNYQFMKLNLSVGRVSMDVYRNYEDEILF